MDVIKLSKWVFVNIDCKHWAVEPFCFDDRQTNILYISTGVRVVYT